MFQELLESKATRQRGGWGTFASAVLHGGVVALAIVATMKSVDAAPGPDLTIEKTIWVAPPAPRPAPVTPRGPTPPGPAAPSLPTLPSLNLSEIPTKIPPAGQAIDAETMSQLEKGLVGAGPSVTGAVGGTGVSATVTDGVYDVQTVDKAVVSVGDNPLPRYPEMLRQAGVEGTVLAQFVVDTLGRVDMRTFRVLSADHDLFADAVRQTLPRMRFLPALVGERKVSQLVQMPFQFTVDK